MCGVDDFCVLLYGKDSEALTRFKNLLHDHVVDFEICTADSLGAVRDRLRETPEIDCLVGDATAFSESPALGGSMVTPSNPDFPIVVLTEPETPAYRRRTAIRALPKSTLRTAGETLGTVVAATITDPIPVQMTRSSTDKSSDSQTITIVAEPNGRLRDWSAPLTDTLQNNSQNEAATLYDLVPAHEHEMVTAAIETVADHGTATTILHLPCAAAALGVYELRFVELASDTGERTIGVLGNRLDTAAMTGATDGGFERSTQQLLTADSSEEVASITAAAIDDLPSDALGIVYRQDGASLTPVAANDRARQELGEIEPYPVDGEQPIPTAFRTEQPRAVSVEEIGDGRERAAITEEIVHPLDSSGVLVLGVPPDGEVQPPDHNQITRLANAAAATLDHLETESPIATDTDHLETLSTTVRDLFDASTKHELARTLAVSGATVFGVSAATVFFWDQETGALQPVDDDTEPVLDHPQFVGEADLALAVFATGDTRLETDVESYADEGQDGAVPPVELVVPLGDYGVVCFPGSTTEAFDEHDRGVGKLVGTIAGSALDNIDQVESLREQQAHHREQTTELRRVERLNTLVRTVTNELVDAGTITEIQEAVCSTLTTVDHYEFVWVGHRPPNTDEFVVDAAAGDDRTLLDYIVAERGSASVPVQVSESGQSLVIDDITTADAVGSWGYPALRRGYQSVACLPLVWEGHEYGWVELFADTPGLFDAEERAVLKDVATLTANAMNAVERKEALIGGESTELVLEFEAVDDPVFELARRVETRLEIQGVVPSGDGQWTVFMECDSDVVQRLQEVGTEFVSIAGVEIGQNAGGDAVVKVTVSGLTVVEVMAKHGASLQSLVVDGTTGRVTVGIPPSTDVRAFVESCEQVLGRTSLIRRDPSPGQNQTLSGIDLDERLTEKQFEALQAGYFDGYFEVPRRSTGQEVAAELGVSGPTFNHHIRKGMHRLLHALFTNGE